MLSGNEFRKDSLAPITDTEIEIKSTNIVDLTEKRLRTWTMMLRRMMLKTRTLKI